MKLPLSTENDRGGLSLVDLHERFAAQRTAWRDAMEYGLAANRRMMDAFIRHSFEQGATAAPMEYERIFAASTLDGRPRPRRAPTPAINLC